MVSLCQGIKVWLVSISLVYIIAVYVFYQWNIFKGLLKAWNWHILHCLQPFTLLGTSVVFYCLKSKKTLKYLILWKWYFWGFLHQTTEVKFHWFAWECKQIAFSKYFLYKVVKQNKALKKYISKKKWRNSYRLIVVIHLVTVKFMEEQYCLFRALWLNHSIHMDYSRLV